MVAALVELVNDLRLFTLANIVRAALIVALVVGDQTSVVLLTSALITTPFYFCCPF